MKSLPHRTLRIFNVLIVVSLLFGATAPVVSARERPEFAGAQEAQYASSEPPAANILAVVDVFGPLTVAPDEQVTLQVQVVNVGVEPILWCACDHA